MSAVPKLYDSDAFADPVVEDRERCCLRCRQILPPTAYASPTYNVCRKCRNSRTTQQVDRLKDALTKLATQQIVAATRGDRLDAPRISQVCAEVFARFGGVNKFCEKWFEHLTSAMQDRPGSRLVLDQFRSLAKLAKESADSLDNAGANIAGISDEDLNILITQEIQKTLGDTISNITPALESDLEVEDEENVRY